MEPKRHTVCFCVHNIPGPLQIEILNKKGESLSNMPTVGQGLGKKLVIELKVVLNGKKNETHSSKPLKS